MAPADYADWNPWHGCTKISPGCKYCYVYRQDEMYGSDKRTDLVTKNADFDLPVRRKRDKSYKIPSGAVVFTCFTSDFLVKDADVWRSEAWAMMKLRSDLTFYFFTKRIDRLRKCLPEDWGDGYDNVIIGCTVENQERADYRLPVFLDLPIRHRSIIVAPILGRIDLGPYLAPCIEEVAVSGESGIQARVCDFEWVLDIRRQCMEQDIPFSFHQTGAKLRKGGKIYCIPRKFQISQARKAAIDYRISPDGKPENGEWK
ncbi:MAG: phage Gp37/Gp68 family protein [Bacteroidales bacterium]|jgi:protein gp37|nr:phage Gp37/Gp68 family protein [Bacteroidales bacterium]MCI1786209.1 phage Gp37/Gp68 family protein [Bacteroidales bacterium]